MLELGPLPLGLSDTCQIQVQSIGNPPLKETAQGLCPFLVRILAQLMHDQ